MTCKAIALLRRRADMSAAAFVEYYETKHAPLIMSLLPGIVDYRRNYADFGGAFAMEGASPFDFDVVTEIWFATRAAYDAAMVVAGHAEIWERIALDEANFLDRSGTRMFLVEEHASPAC